MSNSWERHLTKNQESLYKSESEEDSIGNPFANNQINVMSYKKDSEILDRRATGDSVTYQIDQYDRRHILRGACLRFRLPPLKVKTAHSQNVQIAWCPDIAHAIVELAQFKIDGDVKAQLDSISLIHHFQWLYETGSSSSEKRQVENRRIGNVPELVNFSNFLPKYSIYSHQPWFFSQGTILAFPLRKLYHGIYQNLEFVYFYRRAISKLLRIRIREDEFSQWNEISFDEAREYLEGIPQDGLLPIPEIDCSYGIMGEKMINWFTTCAPESSRQIRYQTLKRISSDVVTRKSDLVVNLTNNCPCLSMMWSVLNQRQKEKNHHTCFLDSRGQVPIEKCSLMMMYDTEKDIFRDDAEYFSEGNIRDFSSSPLSKGHHGYSFALSTSSLDSDSTIEFEQGRQAKLRCSFSRDSSEEDDFSLEVTLQEIHQMKIVPEGNHWKIVYVF